MLVSNANLILTLPYELRQILYSLIFTATQPRQDSTQSTKVINKTPKTEPPPFRSEFLRNLAITCHAHYGDVSEFCYANVTLIFHSPAHMCARLTSMGALERRYISQVKLDVPCIINSSDTGISHAFHLLAESKNLNLLWLGIWEQSTERLRRLKSPHLRAMLEGLEGVRAKERGPMDFRVREVNDSPFKKKKKRTNWLGLVQDVRPLVVLWKGVFEMDVEEVENIWGSVSRFQSGVVENFEREMRDVICGRIAAGEVEQGVVANVSGLSM